MDKIMLMIMYLCYNFYILCSVLKWGLNIISSLESVNKGVYLYVRE